MIPNSISSMVYGMKHPSMWTIPIWGIATLGLLTMPQYDRYYAGMAFASCACLVFCGAMPLVRNESNLLHNILGIAACVTSQLWCVFAGEWYVPFVLWAEYLLMLPFMEGKWCFWAEVMCLFVVVVTLML